MRDTAICPDLNFIFGDRRIMRQTLIEEGEVYSMVVSHVAVSE